MPETGDILPLVAAAGKCAFIDQGVEFGSQFSNAPILGGGEKFLVDVPVSGHPVMRPAHRNLVIAAVVCRHQLQVVRSSVSFLEALAELL